MVFDMVIVCCVRFDLNQSKFSSIVIIYSDYKTKLIVKKEMGCTDGLRKVVVLTKKLITKQLIT